MNVQITFKHFDHTQALDSLIMKKTKKLKKYLSTNSKVTWNCFIDRDDQICEVNLSGFKGPDITATAKAESLYKSIDLVIEKLEKQLRKRHKEINKKIHGRTKLDFHQMEAS